MATERLNLSAVRERGLLMPELGLFEYGLFVLGGAAGTLFQKTWPAPHWSAQFALGLIGIGFMYAGVS